LNLKINKTSLKKAWKSSKWFLALLVTALIGAYFGNAVPKWLAEKKVIQIERGFSNKTLPAKLRYKADGTRFPYFFATQFRMENIGNVDLSNEDIKVILANSSMDCGIIKSTDHRVKAFGLRGKEQFDSDFNNFIYVNDAKSASIYLSDLKRGEHVVFLLFSNFAFRPAFIPSDGDLKIKTRTPIKPDASFEDDPSKLTNCDHLLPYAVVDERQIIEQSAKAPVPNGVAK
jgi:hypothetical protein